MLKKSSIKICLQVNDTEINLVRAPQRLINIPEAGFPKKLIHL